MAKPSQSSFRRILLLRILLLSVPVLLIGEAVAFKKARSSMLETARWNLTESAVRKGESITSAIAALKANLLVASQTTAIKSGSPEEAQQLLNQLALQLPTNIQCIQLTNLLTGDIVTSTCKNEYINSYSSYKNSWPQKQEQSQLDPKYIYVRPVLTPNIPSSAQQFDSAEITTPHGQLKLLLSAPVYDSTGRLHYSLSIQSALHQQESDEPGLLAGSTVVIDENGTILAHPIFERVGRNINQEADAERFKGIVQNAIAGRKDFLHLSFTEKGPELLAGYNIITSPITTQPGEYWIILAVTRLDNALFGLKEIKVILAVLTIGLLGASLLATLYMARDLARPLEKLRDYALNLQSYHEAERVPHNFKVREVEQLAEALDRMVERLKVSAEEIETAWEEAQASNRLKSEFLATTSHELRTPLNAIIGCVQLVMDGYCDNKQEETEYLQQAKQAAVHLLHIINDLLDINKIEAGKLSLSLELTDLRQVLKEVINLQSVHIQQKGLQLVTNESLAPMLVHADPNKLKQVLLNVVGNALKFTDQGSITINTRIESAVENLDSSSISPQVVITVEDTGVGIDPAQQHKLFRPFVMVDGTTTRKFGGTGLGLAISRNLMEMMGGSIMLCSAGLNQGTTVAISLPLMDISLLRSHLQGEAGDTNVAPEETSIGEKSNYMAGVSADENKNGKI